MICATCGDTTETTEDVCTLCGEAALMRDAYRLDAVVGQGSSGVTYRGTRLSDNQPVAIKELPFHRIESTKKQMLFEREAAILKQLEHPRIPRYFDDFVQGSGKHLGLCIVQEFIPGRTLHETLENHRYNEAEVLGILVELLDILRYLHTLSPPVVHRDIKPRNIIRRTADSALFLVDFGSVQDALNTAAAGGSTVAGTFGYMAPEVFQGQAFPASDIYSLGALAVALLTRRSPDVLLDYNNRLDWESEVSLSEPIRVVLRSMLEADPEQRAHSASDLQRQLQQILDTPQSLVPTKQTTQRSKPWQRALQSIKVWPKHRQIAAGGAILSIALCLSGSLFWMMSSPATTAPKPLKPSLPKLSDTLPAPLETLMELEFGASPQTVRNMLEGSQLEEKHYHAIVPIHLGALLGTTSLLTGESTTKGPALEAVGTFQTKPVQCLLGFTSKQQFFKVTCTFTGFNDEANFTFAEKTLHRALAHAYGDPIDISSESNSIGGIEALGLAAKRHNTWRWKDEFSTLILSATLLESSTAALTTATIHLEHTWAHKTPSRRHPF